MIHYLSFREASKVSFGQKENEFLKELPNVFV